MALTWLKGGTECGYNWVKNTIYSAPAVKGLTNHTESAGLDARLTAPGTVTASRWEGHLTQERPDVD